MAGGVRRSRSQARSDSRRRRESHVPEAVHVPLRGVAQLQGVHRPPGRGPARGRGAPQLAEGPGPPARSAEGHGRRRACDDAVRPAQQQRRVRVVAPAGAGAGRRQPVRGAPRHGVEGRDGEVGRDLVAAAGAGPGRAEAEGVGQQGGGGEAAGREVPGPARAGEAVSVLPDQPDLRTARTAAGRRRGGGARAC